MSQLDCPLQARCPGCPLGDEAYQVGLSRKGDDLARALAPYTELRPELLPPRAASPTHAYRLRAKLVVEGKSLGLFERGSHSVIDVSGCRILSPALTRATAVVRRALPLPIYGADLRVTSEGVLLTLLTDQPVARTQLEAVARDLVQQGLAGVALSVRPPGNVRLLAGEPEVVAGSETARHRLSEDLPYAYAAPGGFVQAHAGQASYVQAAIMMRLRAGRAAPTGQRVLELFAGNGSLALALAREGASVTAVEAFAPAVKLARRAAKEQGLNVQAVTSDAARYAESAAAHEHFDAAIVNPPRRGLAPALRRALANTKIETLVYVSCNPRTLARDAWHLRQLGFGLQTVEPLDMIPWSEAVEAIAWFERQAPPPPRVLFERDGWLAVEKNPWQAVATPRAQADLLARVRASLAPAAVAMDAWGEGVSGVCLFAKEPRAEPELRAALETAARELVLTVRGNLRKQGTITRRGKGPATPGTRYQKQRDVGRHSLASVFTREAADADIRRDFASIGHPVLGDSEHGDRRSNEYVEHRHGLDRAFVHCRSVRFCLAGEDCEVVSELAPDLAEALSSLGSD